MGGERGNIFYYIERWDWVERIMKGKDICVALSFNLFYGAISLTCDSMGRKMEIRPIKEEDAKEFLEMLLKLDKQTELMTYEVGEHPPELDNILTAIRICEKKDNLLLVALEEAKIIGFLGAARGEFNRSRHSVSITIGILEDYRHQGIGSAMSEQMEQWARRAGIVRLELTVICHNTQAVRLYEKKGFFIEGIRKKSLFVNGKYIDEYYMGKILV